MLENIKNNSLVLQNKLEKAENEIVKQFAWSKEWESHIFTLESRIKEDHGTFLKYKSEKTEARKIKKSLEGKIQSQEKIIYSNQGGWTKISSMKKKSLRRKGLIC